MVGEVASEPRRTMTAKSTYALFAEFYDAFVGDYAADIPFYLALAGQCHPPILEAGCGTGRVLLPLLRAGYQVAGVDISHEMLALARAKLSGEECADRYLLISHDLAARPLAGQYGLALVTFYTFNYLLDDDRQSSFLHNIATSLAAGARIALHLFYPAPLAHPETAGRWTEKGPYQVGGESVTLRDQRTMLNEDTEERIQVFCFASGRREEIRTLRRLVRREEICRLLLGAGFTSPLVGEDFDFGHLASPDASAATVREFMIVAQKA